MPGPEPEPEPDLKPKSVEPEPEEEAAKARKTGPYTGLLRPVIKSFKNTEEVRTTPPHAHDSILHARVRLSQRGSSEFLVTSLSMGNLHTKVLICRSVNVNHEC